MAFLLIIDTALEQGSVGIFRGKDQLGILQNNTQKDHAAFVQTAITQLEKETATALNDLDAIAVVNGPGSYTGLRVGLATAKGLCYALDKKLILVNTLDIMAFASINTTEKKDCYYAPMIDARRDDVFTGIYNNDGKLVSEQQALTITPDSFLSFTTEKPLVLSGSGAKKAAAILPKEAIIATDICYQASEINTIAQEKFDEGDFADVAYSEPNYLKAFYSTAKIHT
ncbi:MULTISPECIES: tRNA (adenosine(37)-N6)-threonylcarbamoyltransferase complex dimerization subunit type 1 TsaB [Chitinophagaceae]